MVALCSSGVLLHREQAALMSPVCPCARNTLKAFAWLRLCFSFALNGCSLNAFLPLVPPSPFFLDTSEIWWQDPPSLQAELASWDMTEVAAVCKAADESSDPSPQEGNSTEEPDVQDPVSACLDGEPAFPGAQKKWGTFDIWGVPALCAARATLGLGFRSWRPSKPNCGR